MPACSSATIGEQKRVLGLLVLFELGYREEALDCITEPLAVLRLQAELRRADSFFLGCHAGDDKCAFFLRVDLSCTLVELLSDDLSLQVLRPVVELPLDKGHIQRPAMISVILQCVGFLKSRASLVYLLIALLYFILSYEARFVSFLLFLDENVRELL